MKKIIFLAFMFYCDSIFCMMTTNHDLYKSFLITKTYMNLYVDLCQKASFSAENQEIEKYLNKSLKIFLSKSLPGIKNQLVVDYIMLSFEQNGWKAVQECSPRIERTEKSMRFTLSYDKQIIKNLVTENIKYFKQNLTSAARNDKREDVVKFIQDNL